MACENTRDCPCTVNCPRHGICCACGSEKYTMEVRPAAVDIKCSDCGAKLRIDASTDEDLDRLCCQMTLRIKGEKK